jgi:hypothetical protein
MVRARVGIGLRVLIIVGVRARCSDLLKNLVSMLYKNQSFSSCNFLCPFWWYILFSLICSLLPRSFTIHAIPCSTLPRATFLRVIHFAC